MKAPKPISLKRLLLAYGPWIVFFCLNAWNNPNWLTQATFFDIFIMAAVVGLFAGFVLYLTKPD